MQNKLLKEYLCRYRGEAKAGGWLTSYAVKSANHNQTSPPPILANAVFRLTSYKNPSRNRQIFATSRCDYSFCISEAECRKAARRLTSLYKNQIMYSRKRVICLLQTKIKLRKNGKSHWIGIRPLFIANVILPRRDGRHITSFFANKSKCGVLAYFKIFKGCSFSRITTSVGITRFLSKPLARTIILCFLRI